MAGLIDRTSGGRFAILGPDRAAFLHHYTTQDILGMQPGQAKPAVIPTWKGTIQDWVSVYAGEEALLVATSPGRADELVAFLQKHHLHENLTFQSLTAETACLELLGPCDLAVGQCRIDGLTRLTACEEGLEGTVTRMWLPIQELAATRDRLLQTGAKSLGEAEQERRRVHWGLPRYGRELSDAINPWEARLGGGVSLSKGCYLGQEVIARLDSYDKVKQHLVGLRFARTAPAAGDVVCDGQKVGWITSAADDLALGFVKTALIGPGTLLQVGDQSAEVEDLPFWAGKRFGKRALTQSNS